ncbi:MAG: hypothetical protein IJP52_04590 [Paludibacteraceae bacterium]|nr:hypothetical protein [Paludibacteraceae bacterium]
MKQIHHILILPDRVVVDDQPVTITTQGADIVTELYRRYMNDYPKFFKMDLLSRLGLVAADILLQTEGAERGAERDDRAVVIVNRHASLNNDRAYEATIQPDNYFPSPSLFVYTLPNVVAGEIAIRNHYLGETACYIAAQEDVEPLIASTFNEHTTSVIGGWLDVTDEKEFIAKLSIWTH